MRQRERLGRPALVRRSPADTVTVSGPPPPPARRPWRRVISTMLAAIGHKQSVRKVQTITRTMQTTVGSKLRAEVACGILRPEPVLYAARIVIGPSAAGRVKMGPSSRHVRRRQPASQVEAGSQARIRSPGTEQPTVPVEGCIGPLEPGAAKLPTVISKSTSAGSSIGAPKRQLHELVRRVRVAVEVAAAAGRNDEAHAVQVRHGGSLRTTQQRHESDIVRTVGSPAACHARAEHAGHRLEKAPGMRCRAGAHPAD